MESREVWEEWHNSRMIDCVPAWFVYLINSEVEWRLIVIFKTDSKVIIDCNTAQNANQLIMTSLIDIHVEATRSSGKFIAYQLERLWLYPANYSP